MKTYPLAAILLLCCITSARAQVAVRADTLYTMTGDLKPIIDGVILCSKEGRIEKDEKESSK